MEIIAVLVFLMICDAIIYQKIEKVSQKKYFLNDFTSNHPIATEIPVSVMAKLRQFSHFFNKLINRSIPNFGKIFGGTTVVLP